MSDSVLVGQHLYVIAAVFILTAQLIVKAVEGGSKVHALKHIAPAHFTFRILHLLGGTTCSVKLQH